MLQSDVARIKLKLFPMIQDILGQWIILHFVGISPTSPPTIEDFSYQLSSLQLGNFLKRYDCILTCAIDMHILNRHPTLPLVSYYVLFYEAITCQFQCFVMACIRFWLLSFRTLSCDQHVVCSTGQHTPWLLIIL